MFETSHSPEVVAPDGGFRARHALLKRLADVVSLPASRINAFERAVTGDLLVEMLRLASTEDRRRVAVRLAPLTEVPNALVRILLRDDERGGILFRFEPVGARCFDAFPPCVLLGAFGDSVAVHRTKRLKR